MPPETLALRALHIEKTRGIVAAVSRSPSYTFSKPSEAAITLIAGLGVKGDAHLGATVRHRSRIARDPTVPNLRQVHLIHSELFTELKAQGFHVEPGAIGENITTRGLDILALPRGARLHIGHAAVLEVTGLRNPCAQLDKFQPGLMRATLGKDHASGRLIRKAGIMSVVVTGGEVTPGATIGVELPPLPHYALDVV